MKSFLGKERRNGTYSSAKYDVETKKQFQQWLTDNKIPNQINPAKMHSTIIYSRVAVKDAKTLNLTDPGWIFSAKQLKIIESEGKNVLVIELSAPQLYGHHQKLLAMGATHDFEDFIAHVTASYDVGSVDVSKISLPMFDFKVATVTCEPLDLKWSEDESSD